MGSPGVRRAFRAALRMQFRTHKQVCARAAFPARRFFVGDFALIGGQGLRARIACGFLAGVRPGRRARESGAEGEVCMTEDLWTVKAALDWTVGYLERKGDPNPRLSAQWLMAKACGMERIEVYLNLDRPLSLDERGLLRGYVARRGAGEPLQYITGEVGFRYITVKVRPGVLIPRPETEVLVSEALSLLPEPKRRVARDSTIEAWEGDAILAAQALQEEEAGEGASEKIGGELASAVEELAADISAAGGGAASAPAPSRQKPLLVADLCTGSGCVACSIAHERPLARVVATDIAPEAVDLARENVHDLGLDERVEVVRCDLGEGVPDAWLGSLDLVVSNPPYVPTLLLSQIPREVADFEPTLALDGGEDGLDLFRRILPWSARALKPGGGLAVELHEESLDAAADLARTEGFEDVRIVEDLAGRPRVLTARAPLCADRVSLS